VINSAVGGQPSAASRGHLSMKRVIFVSAHAFLRDSVFHSARRYFEDSLVVVTDFCRWVLERLLEMGAALVVLDRPSAEEREMVEAAVAEGRVEAVSIIENEEDLPDFVTAPAPQPAIRSASLTERQNEIAVKVAAKRPRKVIARDLGLSDATVKSVRERPDVAETVIHVRPLIEAMRSR